MSLPVGLEKYVQRRPDPETDVETDVVILERREFSVEGGRITLEHYVTAAKLAQLLAERDDPASRPDQTVTIGGVERNLRDLTAEEWEVVTGYKPYFDKWRVEGIPI